MSIISERPHPSRFLINFSHFIRNKFTEEVLFLYCLQRITALTERVITTISNVQRSVTPDFKSSFRSCNYFFIIICCGLFEFCQSGRHQAGWIPIRWSSPFRIIKPLVYQLLRNRHWWLLMPRVLSTSAIPEFSWRQSVSVSAEKLKFSALQRWEKPWDVYTLHQSHTMRNPELHLRGKEMSNPKRKGLFIYCFWHFSGSAVLAVYQFMVFRSIRTLMQCLLNVQKYASGNF